MIRDTQRDKALLLGMRFALQKLGVQDDSPLARWMEQEFQAWLTAGYEAVLQQSIFAHETNAAIDRSRRRFHKALLSGTALTKFRWEKPHERAKSLRPKPSGKAARKQKARHIKKVAASRSARRKATRRR